jgi:peptidoglycan/LPS O-acetylase OafA/YrhL
VLAVLGFLGLLRKQIIIFVLMMACLYWDYRFHIPGVETNGIWFVHYGIFFASGALLSILVVRPPILLFSLFVSVLSFYFEFWVAGIAFSLPLFIIYFGERSTPVISEIYRIGDISYGTYLLAFPIQQALIHFLGEKLPYIFMALLSLMMTYSLAYISWRLVELPCIKLKKYFG